jgi:hypothetical protein
MNGQAYHDSAVRQIEAALGWVMSVQEFEALIDVKAGAAVF